MAWEPDYAWQYGHDPHETRYTLHGTLPPEHVAALWEALDGAELDLGGVAIERDGETVVVTSGGEDAMESLASGVDVVEGACIYAGIPEPQWEELAPVTEGDVVLTNVDGYWVRPDDVVEFGERRERCAARIAEVLGSQLAEAPEWTTDERGVSLLTVRHRDGAEIHLLAGPAQLDLIDEADAGGQLAEYIFAGA